MSNEVEKGQVLVRRIYTNADNISVKVADPNIASVKIIRIDDKKECKKEPLLKRIFARNSSQS